MLPIECGLFGICSQNDSDIILKTTLESLQKLQHRGQDSFGISYFNTNHELITAKYIGLVEQNYDKCMKDNYGQIESINYPQYGYSNIVNIIGHLRYKTSGKQTTDEYQNIQPFNNSSSKYSIAHNGNIKNTELLHKTLMSLCPNITDEEAVELKQRNHDTYYMLQILDNLKAETIEDKLIQFLYIVPGVYCLLLLIDDII